jgi:hypothetical protein
MTYTKREARIYYHIEHEKQIPTRVIYSLIFDGRKLSKVFNEYGFSVEENSECWEFFNIKYNG